MQKIINNVCLGLQNRLNLNKIASQTKYYNKIRRFEQFFSRQVCVTGSNFQSWSTSKCHTAGTTLQIIDMTKLHPSCIIKVTWFSVDIISPLLDAFFLHIIVVLTATGYPLHLHQYLLLEKDPVTTVLKEGWVIVRLDPVKVLFSSYGEKVEKHIHGWISLPPIPH